jgi:hypothetical protein
MAKTPFFGKPGKQHPDGGHVVFDRRRRGPALQRLDVSGDSDGLNVFKVLISGALSPGQELLDCAIVGGSCVSVANRDRKKLEELLASRWRGARYDGGSWCRFQLKRRLAELRQPGLDPASLGQWCKAMTNRDSIRTPKSNCRQSRSTYSARSAPSH